MTITYSNATTPPVPGTSSTLIWEGYVRADEVLPGDEVFPTGTVEKTVRVGSGYYVIIKGRVAEYFLVDDMFYVERTVTVTFDSEHC